MSWGVGQKDFAHAVYHSKQVRNSEAEVLQWYSQYIEYSSLPEPLKDKIHILDWLTNKMLLDYRSPTVSITQL